MKKKKVRKEVQSIVDGICAEFETALASAIPVIAQAVKNGDHPIPHLQLQILTEATPEELERLMQKTWKAIKAAGETKGDWPKHFEVKE